MRKRKPKERLFQCPVCGNVLNFPKLKHITYAGHIKTAYCPFCKEDRDWVQIDEYSRTMADTEGVRNEIDLHSQVYEF